MEAMKRTKVYTASDRVEAEMLVEALKNNNIAAYRQGISSGGYMDIYAGNSIFGEEIFVDEADVAAAQDIIEGITGNILTQDGEEGDAVQEAEEEIQPEKKERSAVKTGGKILVLAYVAVLLIMVTYTVIMNFLR